MMPPAAAATRPNYARTPKPAAPPIHRSSSAGALAAIMSLYVVITVGRIGDIVPLLSALPLAKLVAATAILMALLGREAPAARTVWYLTPAKFTLLFMLLAAVSILFSVLRSGTLGV